MPKLPPAYPQTCTQHLWVKQCQSDRRSSRNVQQRRQVVPRPCSRAGIVADIELAAGRRPRIVDGATDTAPDFAGKCHAEWHSSIGAAHADDLRGDRHAHHQRHPLPPGKRAAGQLDRMKIDPEGCTAGATGRTGIAVITAHRDRPRNGKAPGRSRDTCARTARPAHRQRTIPMAPRVRVHAPAQRQIPRRRSASCCGTR